jgi:hypothetical protein
MQSTTGVCQFQQSALRTLHSLHVPTDLCTIEICGRSLQWQEYKESPIGADEQLKNRGAKEPPQLAPANASTDA